MAEEVKVWFDPELDYLEVQFREAPGFMRATAHDALMERVDEQGHVLGFSVLGVSQFRKDHPWDAELVAGESFRQYCRNDEFPCLLESCSADDLMAGHSFRTFS